MNKHEFHSLVDAMEKDTNKLYVEISAIDDVEVLLDLGDEFADKPEFGVRFCDRAIAVDPTNLRAVLSAGACYLLAGNDLDAYYMLILLCHKIGSVRCLPQHGHRGTRAARMTLS